MFCSRRIGPRVTVDEARRRTSGMNAWASAGHPVVDKRGNSGHIA